MKDYFINLNGRLERLCNPVRVVWAGASDYQVSLIVEDLLVFEFESINFLVWYNPTEDSTQNVRLLLAVYSFLTAVFQRPLRINQTFKLNESSAISDCGFSRWMRQIINHYIVIEPKGLDF